MGYAKFDSADKTAYIALSNSDLTATVVTGAPTYSSARSDLGKTAGKIYWEVTVDALGTAGSVHAGVVCRASNTAALGYDNVSAGVHSDDGEGYFDYLNLEDFAFTGTVYPVGTVMGFALDLDANPNTLRVYKNNTYIGSFVSLPNQETWAAVTLKSVGTAATANFGATAFVYSHPTSPAVYSDRFYVDSGTSSTIAFTAANATVAAAVTVTQPNTAAIAFTAANAIVAAAVTAHQPKTAAIAFTAANATVAAIGIHGSASTAIAFTTANATVAAAVTTQGQSRQVAVAFSTQNAVVAAAVSHYATSSAAITFTAANATVAAVVATAITEPFTAKVRHKTTGAPITALTTVLLTAIRASDGYRFDFSDNTFKSSPTTLTLALAEVSASLQSGLYRSAVTTTNWSGWIETEATYDDGSYIYSYTGEAHYTSGVRDTVSSSSALTAQESAQLLALPSAATTASAVRTELTTELADIITTRKYTENERIFAQDGTGGITVKDDNGAAWKTGTAYSDSAATTPYSGIAGDAIHRTTRLT